MDHNEATDPLVGLYVVDPNAPFRPSWEGAVVAAEEDGSFLILLDLSKFTDHGEYDPGHETTDLVVAAVKARRQKVVMHLQHLALTRDEVPWGRGFFPSSAAEYAWYEELEGSPKEGATEGTIVATLRDGFCLIDLKASKGYRFHPGKRVVMHRRDLAGWDIGLHE